jgi:hypothetical protein
MIRVIKFRGKRIDTKEWVYGHYVGDSLGHQIVTKDGSCWIVDPKTVGQFTGLVDKNGKEIFEGDVDKSGLFVAWNQLHCCWGLFSQSGFQSEILADFCDEKGNTPKEWMSSEIEVIGNIFENPNLLQP